MRNPKITSKKNLPWYVECNFFIQFCMKILVYVYLVPLLVWCIIYLTILLYTCWTILANTTLILCMTIFIFSLIYYAIDEVREKTVKLRINIVRLVLFQRVGGLEGGGWWREARQWQCLYIWVDQDTSHSFVCAAIEHIQHVQSPHHR